MKNAIKVLYVENDEALLGLLGGSLAIHPEISELAKASTSEQAFALSKNQVFDAALVDISLGPESINGVELAFGLREKNEHLGIVLLSQYSGDSYLQPLKTQLRYGWAAIQKTATLSMDQIVQTLKATAAGLNVSDPNSDNLFAQRGNLSAALTKRQRQVISLAATGLDAPEIAKQLSLAAVTIRQELSKAYKILVPNPKPGTDLRTSAVLRYLRETREL
jgi:two-component system response regulator DesR